MLSIGKRSMNVGSLERDQREDYATVVMSTIGLFFYKRSQISFIHLIVKMCKTIAATTDSSRSSAMCLWVRRRRSSCYFSPARLEEVAHSMASFAHGAVVFIEDFAIYKHLPNVSAKIVSRFISKTTKYFINWVSWLRSCCLWPSLVNII